MRRLAAAAAFLLMLSFPDGVPRAEEPPPIDDTVAAGDADAVEPARKLPWNEFDWKYSTFRFGGGFLTDFADYGQDAESKQQVTLDNGDVGLRDFRILFKGKLKTQRPISWTLGYMYDGAEKEWRFRQTGFTIGVPEWKGSFFVGRTKEGYSLIKVMVGYSGWANERSQANDAFVPILADGVKWSGYHREPHIFYQLGFYGDELSEEEKFSTYDHQIAARVGWNPSRDDGQKVFHVAVMGRDGDPDEGSLQVRARPGSYLAPYFLDTGKIASDHARTEGFEAFYRTGPLLFGTEYNVLQVDAKAGGTPLFHGGDAVVSWNITGETRSYNAPGAFFEAVSPKRTVFEGGPGAFEAVLVCTYADFDDGAFTGGKYWRFTPMVNWHMSDNVRLEFIYGYGSLDRFDLLGRTHFAQFRLQLTL